MPADIQSLEIEFAKHPTLDTCLPLCEAYLQAKRFMEAMVVCKKGIKTAGSQDVRGRVMLARIYLEQGKLPKAEQEILQVQAEFPDHAMVLELIGRLFQQQGKRSEAVAVLEQALKIDPSLQQARDLLAELGVTQAAEKPKAETLSAPSAVASQKPVSAPPPAATVSSKPLAQPAVNKNPPPATPHVAPEASQAARSREHVQDFFAPDALGFNADTPHDIETAGPGRLTIVGFVPKKTGSFKVTLLWLVFIVVAVGAYAVWQSIHSHQETQIATLFKQIRTELDADTFIGYKHVLSLGDQILKLNDHHGLTLSAMAYAQAVLATEHAQKDALAQAKDLLQKASLATQEENEFRVAAQALLSHADKHDEQGLIEIKAILAKGGSSPLVELEAFRLMDTVDADNKDSQIQLRRLVQIVVSQARIFNYLGWYYYQNDDLNKAARYFDQTLQNVKNHPVGLLGRQLVALGQNVGLTQKQNDISQDIKTVLALPPEELSPPVAALAYFTRSQLEFWQKNETQAQADFEQANKLNPQNSLFAYRRGMTLLQAGDAQAAVEALSQVVEAAPHQRNFLKKLVGAQIQAQQFSAAEASLERLSQLNPNDVDKHFLQGSLFLQQHNYSKAIDSYKAIGRSDGDLLYVDAQLAIAEAMRKNNQSTAAVQFMESLLHNLPEGAGAEQLARAWCELGQNYEITKNREKALQSYQAGLEQNRYDADCHFFMCRLLEHGSAALESCKTYLTLDPHGKYATAAESLSSQSK